jgi:hypothetical protein
MAFTAVNAVLEPTAASKTGQIILRGPGDTIYDVYRGFAQITLDGSSTSGTVNFIDGTQGLAYAPSVILVWRSTPPSGLSAVATSTAYSVGQQVKDSSGNIYICRVAGTSASSAPTYNATVGAYTQDGTVTWQCQMLVDSDSSPIGVSATVPATAASTIGFTLNLSAHGTSAQTATFGFLALK